MTGLNTLALVDGLVSNAMQLGVFDSVNMHEPKSRPGNGLTLAIWADTIAPYTQGSGLNVTSAVVTFNLRAYTTMLHEPQDSIDPNLMQAVDTLFAQYSQDFDLGGSIRNVDLLGESGAGLSAQAGYLNQSGTIYRIVTIVLPVIINDVWGQSA
jgi:hypothetical protein